MKRDSDNQSAPDMPGGARRADSYIGGADGWRNADEAGSLPPGAHGKSHPSAGLTAGGCSDSPGVPLADTAAPHTPASFPNGDTDAKPSADTANSAAPSLRSNGDAGATPPTDPAGPHSASSFSHAAAAADTPADAAGPHAPASRSHREAGTGAPTAKTAFRVQNQPSAMQGAASSGPTRILHISGVPNARQKLFFASRARYTAYGGARGGGKSWALRRKLVTLCLRYPGIHCLLIRRTYAELKSNHVRPMLSEYRGLVQYRESDKCLYLPNGSSIALGYCSSGRDALRYQGQEYDIIAIDEATQLSEYQFSVFKACLRGVGGFPRRMYLTCNPGGVGHGWVKRLFVDRCFRADEHPDDYLFIPARVYDNPVLLEADPGYVRQLESLPPRLRDAWLLGRWDVFEGQFFPEFQPEIHVCSPQELPAALRCFAALDYGFDMLAALLLGADADGRLYVLREVCRPGLTLREAALAVSELCSGSGAEYLTASPDLWNRRQDTGRSGFEVMQAVPGVPPMCAADNRRIPGWRMLREFLSSATGSPRLRVCSCCRALIQSLPALLCDADRPEDASDEPHAVTHAPEALRYAVMSRFAAWTEQDQPDRNFRFPRRSRSLDGF